MLEYLDSYGCTLIIMKNGKRIFSSNMKGLRPLLLAIEEIGPDMKGATVIDSVAGLAAAKLYSHAKVKEVHAKLASEKAVHHLMKKNITFHYTTSVPNILDMHRQDICPMERLGVLTEDDSEFYEKIKTKLTTQ